MASTSVQTDKPDPALLGVSVPLSVTVAAAKQVGAAWQKFGMDLMEAVKHAREAKTPPPEDKSATDGAASAAAGVSA